MHNGGVGSVGVGVAGVGDVGVSGVGLLGQSMPVCIALSPSDGNCLT